MAKQPEIKIKRDPIKRTLFQKIQRIVDNTTFAEYGVVLLATCMIFQACINNDRPYVHHTYAQFCQFNTSPYLDEAAMIDNAHACIKEVLAKR